MTTDELPTPAPKPAYVVRGLQTDGETCTPCYDVSAAVQHAGLLLTRGALSVTITPEQRPV